MVRSHTNLPSLFFAFDRLGHLEVDKLSIMNNRGNISDSNLVSTTTPTLDVPNSYMHCMLILLDSENVLDCEAADGHVRNTDGSVVSVLFLAWGFSFIYSFVRSCVPAGKRWHRRPERACVL